MGDQGKKGRARVVTREDYSPQGFRWLRLKRLSYVDRRGNKRNWESAERSTRPPSGIDAVAVYARLVSKGSKGGEQVVLVSQFRPPLDCNVLELPAGLVDSGETPAEAALRELREETGLVGKATRESPVVFSDPGMSSANMKLVEVVVDMDDTRNQVPTQELDEGEDIKVHYVSADKLGQELQSLSESEDLAIDARLYAVAFGQDLNRPPPSSSRGWMSKKMDFSFSVDPQMVLFTSAVFLSTAVLARLTKHLFLSK
ncbi:ADP-sugar pyrophosphatase [Chloropicon primus]|uniref:ADP-sugar pyrophosphatase n=1 Tax=Chloropicon primus TaxID=1764295 RepID=A0A5B8MYM4_9CHLO|nr:ADP-sugar pyrophosphatase [Chloropicon primus]UPR04361.1 ADP-sugar pyrophosphatase [Chloropicon primus]|mmetsp:Transcript_2303/g.6360  ORF Transcript_2303/g.6360 Transcript_2303/m.6360 type:complete len:257 (-) Transcript_2303:2575-3345(-)|eukprot:QDZ25156.1 ADP-sugar pyrophosphatase [Chloropicon primus]